MGATAAAVVTGLAGYMAAGDAKDTADINAKRLAAQQQADTDNLNSTLASLSTPDAAPAPMPVPLPDDQAQVQAKRRSISDQIARRGRASTILTDANSGDRLGG